MINIIKETKSYGVMPSASILCRIEAGEAGFAGMWVLTYEPTEFAQCSSKASNKLDRRAALLGIPWVSQNKGGSL